MIAEEKRLGTIELIYSRPLTEREIIYGKFFSAVALVLFSLIPFVIAFITVFIYGNPKGNIDFGGTLGSFTGLFLLAAVYASIGIFVSSLTDNQVVAFVISVLLCFIMFAGFDSFSYLPSLKNAAEIISGIGINGHYRSVSRGVIDLRDIMYYVAMVVVFSEGARLSLLSRKWKKKS
jgi:ABC-2 type transport system permease protein